jgi:hypothetical protein
LSELAIDKISLKRQPTSSKNVVARRLLFPKALKTTLNQGANDLRLRFFPAAGKNLDFRPHVASEPNATSDHAVAFRELGSSPSFHSTVLVYIVIRVG